MDGITDLMVMKFEQALGVGDGQGRPVNNPTVAFKCSGEIKSYTSLSLNQKRNMIKLPEEGMSKTEIGFNSACIKQPSCECKGKVLEEN